MKYSGKARREGVRLIWAGTLILLLILVAGAVALLAAPILPAIVSIVVLAWVLFAGFVLLFFRDPEPRTPQDEDAIVAPAHGLVDTVDEIEEAEFIRGRCRRISVFLSVFDVHVQNAPVSGNVAWSKYCPGQFLNAMRKDCALWNENLFFGVETERDHGRVGIRLIAGLIARRIVPWAQSGDELKRGERIGMIQFGSRVDLLLPLETKVQVRVGQRVKGGETIVARW